MNTRKLHRTNSAIYFFALVIIVVAFLLLGGGAWFNRITQGSGFLHLPNWNWTQILISFGLGFLIGLLVSRRK